MADEIKTETSVTENEEFEAEPASFYEDDDADWDNVKWEAEGEEEAGTKIPFSQGEKDGKKFVQIGLATYYLVK